jgi:hypothetical protein
MGSLSATTRRKLLGLNALAWLNRGIERFII